MATFVLIFSMVFTTSTGAPKLVTVVYPVAMTYQQCTAMRKTTKDHRHEKARSYAYDKNYAIKHVFSTCSNVKKLLDSQRNSNF